MIFRDNAPYSEAFGDIYFNPTHGLAETEYVFLKANRLEERFIEKKRFVIGELGFGTGLNFLATLKLWQDLPHPKAELHYFSIEKHPLTLAELQQAHALFPKLAPQAKLLQSQYPPILPGFHIVRVSTWVTLYLLIGDVAEKLPELEGPIDAWFLDGFAPKHNPDMWSPFVLETLAKRSDLNTTLSTFSAAGTLRKNLEQIGFQVHKIKGFGIKKEMITACFTNSYISPIRPWLARPASLSGKKIAILGAGLSGLMNAFQLQSIGFEVELFEQENSFPNLQCQNPAMLLRPYFSPNLNFFDQHFTQGFIGMRRFIKEHIPEAIIAEKEWECAVSPAISAAALSQNLTIHLGARVDALSLKQNFDAVIIATGQFLDFGKPTPGQVNIAKGATDILTYQGGYCLPDGKGNIVYGSSFRHAPSLEVLNKDSEYNIENLANASLELAQSITPSSAFVGMRYTTPDHLPIVGGLPLHNEWLETYDRLRFGDKRPHYPACPYDSGIFLTLAHGSKGLSSSYMASTIIVALIAGRPLPISLGLWNALHPARFWLRNLIRCGA